MKCLMMSLFLPAYFFPQESFHLPSYLASALILSSYDIIYLFTLKVVKDTFPRTRGPGTQQLKEKYSTIKAVFSKGTELGIPVQEEHLPAESTSSALPQSVCLLPWGFSQNQKIQALVKCTYYHRDRLALTRIVLPWGQEQLRERCGHLRAGPSHHKLFTHKRC